MTSRRISQPEVPSFARGRPRACVDRFDPVCGHVMVSAAVRNSTVLSLATPRVPLSRHPRLSRARPPSPRIAAIHHLRPIRGRVTKRRHALLWVRLPPNDFCNYIPTHGHTCERPILADSWCHITHPPRTCPCFAVLFTARRPSPFEEGPRDLRAATSPFRHSPRCAASTPRSRMPKVADQSGCRLRATPLPRPPLAAMVVGRQRWTARAE